MERFELLNDFAAAGYGLCQLREENFIRLNRATIIDGGVKCVLGPGTGHGQGVLVKSSFAPCYEVMPTEGGHVEFAPRNKEEFELLEFAHEYIKTSNNVENLRAKTDNLTRISHERLGAGPAVPLIYEFFKKRNPEMKKVLEEGEGAKKADEVQSFDIIKAGLVDKDPLCMMVVKKFTEIFAVEAGDLALKTLPYGGVYLVGGVTMGLSEFLIHDDLFRSTFESKGRLSGMMSRFPVLLLKPEIELGILGAEEYAYRLAGSYSKA